MSANKRGSTKKFHGENPMELIASISSVSFITPICAVYEEALRPATTMAVSNGASSRTAEIVIISTMKILAPNFSSCAAP